ncbi:hypothetical protein XbrCFBP1976_04945 [Xanthomonas bromi]|uniref:Resolvase/invertase-type recombinase catalytic domain-containing protein n=1 Tax=Xanthomonas bromi TaxID=56449 RepID=A0ABX5BSK8_9XANT|nr:hypothetical protein XbrCFBP1976_04945 [Xanthomonas bromi]
MVNREKHRQSITSVSQSWRSITQAFLWGPARRRGLQTASGNRQKLNLGQRLIGYERQPSPQACMRAIYVRDSTRAHATMQSATDFIQAAECAVVQACR